jgi:hypothetical protein
LGNANLRPALSSESVWARATSRAPQTNFDQHSSHL